MNKVLTTKHLTETPSDLAISRCLQNLFATYGEDKVRNSLKELFNLKSKSKKSKKVA